MSRFLRITLTGQDSSVWELAGPEAGTQGVELMPKVKMLFDAPATTFWIKSAFGSFYQGFQYKRRDPVFAVSIHGDNPDDWSLIDSQFRIALGNPNQTFMLTFETDQGSRTLCMRLLEQPVSYETGEWETKDPFLFCDSTLSIPAACENPFWVADPIITSCTFASGTGTEQVWVGNDGDIPIWLEWKITAPCTITLPDYSWGQETLYGAAPGSDATRTVLLPTLVAGEDLDVNSNPDQPLMVAANEDPVVNRAAGIQLLYPVAPFTPLTQVPVTMSGGPSNATVYVISPQWFSRPWGVSL